MVPVARSTYYWAIGSPKDYEESLVARLSEAAREFSGTFSLVDVGADIGLISLRLRARNDNIAFLFAIEPNGEVFPILEANITAAGGRAFQCAVSDFTGRGVLRSPEYDDEEHGRYLEQDESGEIEVKTIDSLGIRGGDVMIKVDVEGAELPALRGARETIASAGRIIIALEAHPLVAKRTGADPMECLRYLNSIRPFVFHTVETGQKVTDKENLFGQLVPDGVFNVIAESC